jgi:methylated-DNA-[protein]-cysteine S-methyltransferase
MKRLSVHSPIGALTLTEEDGAIVALDFADGGGRDETPLLKRARAQLDEYFARQRRSFDLPLRLGGTAFQRAVWNRMLAIPYGETESYGQVAKSLGSAPRAVGGACGANAIPILIPCHRIVGAGRALGGYSGGAGRPIKVALLELERTGAKRKVACPTLL